GPTLFRQLDLLPAKFAGAANDVLCAAGTGQQLRAETDAKYRAPIVREGAHEADKARQPRTAIVRQGVLDAAKYDDSIMMLMGVRDRFAFVRTQDLDLRARFLQSRADLAKLAAVKIKDDEYAHLSPRRSCDVA